MHDYDEGVADDARDRRDIADEIEVELPIKRRIDGVVRCGKEEGIAIWGSAHDRLGAHNPNQTDMYRPGAPASSTVGISGANEIRDLAVTA